MVNRQQFQICQAQNPDDAGVSDDAIVVRALADLNSELANAQRELARRNADLAEAVREKNQMLGMAAHDLRNPLGVIAGVVDVLTVSWAIR